MRKSSCQPTPDCAKPHFMTMLKRLSLFLLVNMMVVTTLSLVMNLLGIQRYTAAYGFNSGSLRIGKTNYRRVSWPSRLRPLK